MCARILHLRIAVDETLGHMKITLLLLGIWAFLFVSTWPQIGHCQYLNPPEVVIPLRITGTSRGTKTASWVSYSLHLEGQRHIVHMKAKKFLVYKHLSVFTYTDQGTLHEDQGFIPRDCYYRGYVEGDPKSLVALSTCFGGFQGMLHINDAYYEIKPKNLSTTSEHLAYKRYPMEVQSLPSRYTITEEDTEKGSQMKFKENNNPTLMQSTISGWFVHQFFYEIGCVVDNKRYLYKNSNISAVKMEVVLCANLVDTYYKTMGVNIVIKAIEIWSSKDLISPTENHNAFRNSFCAWKNKNFHGRVVYDIVVLVTNQTVCSRNRYHTHPFGACNNGHNCGYLCHTDDNLLKFATIMSYVSGRLLGLERDSGTCACVSGNCIMNDSLSVAHEFSNCSYGLFLYNVWNRIRCLYNTPQASYEFAYCGNSVIDEGEECDCGTEKSCSTDLCCTDTCTLISGNDCASGPCCKDCRFLPPGTECRGQINECDLPEWCNGSSSVCPEDVYVEDGFPCLGKGVCFQKQCNNRDYLCRQLFGPASKNADSRCYTELNTKGDRFGHCHRRNLVYTRCSVADALCGRIQCENVTEVPILKEHQTFIWNHLEPLNCWSIDYHFGLTTPDIGAVPNGTECGLGKICINAECVAQPLQTNACLPEDCNERGICNNKHHCHCNDDRAPPNCVREGLGGSIDSGPPPRKYGREYETSSKKKPRAFMYSFLFLAILCLLILLFVLIKKVKEKKAKETVPKETAVPPPPAPSAPTAAPAAPAPPAPPAPAEKKAPGKAKK